MSEHPKARAFGEVVNTTSTIVTMVMVIAGGIYIWGRLSERFDQTTSDVRALKTAVEHDHEIHSADRETLIEVKTIVSEIGKRLDRGDGRRVSIQGN